MNIYDQHLHSNFSPDSMQNIEGYFINAQKDKDEYVITTEHLDFKCVGNNGKDVIPNVSQLILTLGELSQKYSVKGLLGIEAGWRSDIANQIEEFLQQYPFDLVILSVHENSKVDMGSQKFYSILGTDNAYDEYLNLIYEAVTTFDDFDVLGHIDFLLRYAGQTNLDKHKEKLTKVMQVLINKDKALELNTRMIDMYNTTYYTEYMVDLYLSLGGEKMTVSSDAHHTNRHKNNFEIVINILKEKGVKSLYFYKQRKPFTIDI